MRADALRRREAIVAAGRRLFAERGGEVALDAVAEAAGVGVATLYRNFDSRRALAEAVALATLADIRGACDEALDAGASDAWAAWEGFVRRLAELDLGALSSAVSLHLGEAISQVVRAEQSETLERVEAVLASAKASGSARAEVEPLDLVLGVGLLTRALPATVAATAPGLSSRLLTVMLDGMRPRLDDA